MALSLHDARPMLLPAFRSGLAVCLGSLLSLTACGDDPAQDGGGGAGAGGSNAGGAGGGPACPVGSHAGDDGVCEASLAEWTAGPALAQKRDHHVTFVARSDAGPVLYAAGGVVDNTSLQGSIEMSPIAADGSLSAWSSGGTLPEAAAGAGIAVVDKSVIVSGGFRRNGASAVLSRATDIGSVLPDGTIGNWTAGPELSRTRFHHTMVADGPRLYVLGGLTGDNTDNTNVVETATVGADGTVSAWTPVTSLPSKRSHHSAVVHEGAIYVTGGLEGDPAGSNVSFDEVLRAPILADGALGEWSVVGHLPTTLTTHASFVHAGALYVLGGIEDDTQNTAAVRRAPIAADGTVGTWESLPDLPKARAHAHQAPFFQGYVYAVGGALHHASIADVYLGRFE